MKLIIITKSEDLNKKIQFHFSPLGFQIEWYNHPLEVINNIEYMIFDVILFDANDYPRHWKPLIKLLREYKSKEKAVVVLTNKNGFLFEEASKAIHLEINGLIADNLSSRQIIYRLEEILRRYKSLPDNRKFNRLLIKDNDDVAFLFTHPHKTILIFGEILDISIQGMNFMPYNPGLSENLKTGETIRDSSLRIGQDIININFSITRNKGSLGIAFESFSLDGHNKLFHYLMNRPERELNLRLNGNGNNAD